MKTFILKLPEDIHHKIKLLTTFRHITMQQYFQELIKKEIEKEGIDVNAICSNGYPGAE